MPPDHRSPDDPAEWLRRARSNLIRAKLTMPRVYLEDLSFDAQQAAEKAIKAVLHFRRIESLRSHDLAQLLGLLEQAGHQLSPDIREAARLTRFAVSARYPGINEPVTAQEHERAGRIAETVVNWAANQIEPGAAGQST